MTPVKLRTIAQAMSLHPRTVLRAVEDRRDGYWRDDESFDPEVNIEDVAKAFSCEAAGLSRVLAGKDRLMSQKEIAQKMGVPPRTFRYRNYPVFARRNRITLYSLRDVGVHHVKHHEKDEMESLR